MCLFLTLDNTLMDSKKKGFLNDNVDFCSLVLTELILQSLTIDSFKKG